MSSQLASTGPATEALPPTRTGSIYHQGQIVTMQVL